MPHTHTVGIVGAGNVVSSNHLPVLLAMNDIQVAWITDKDATRAHNVAEAYGIPDCNLSQGFAAFPKADAVLLAVPYGARAPYYSVLAGRGIAVYVEKPFARTVAIHRDLCAPFADHAIACGFNRRAWGVVRFWRDVIESRMFGKVRAVRFGFGSLGGIAAGGTYFANAKLAGGGILFESGVHGIDTVLYCLQAQAARLESGNLIMDNGHDIHCHGHLTLIDGCGESVPFDIEVTMLKNSINRLEFEFDGCTVHFSPYGAPELSVESKSGKVQSIITNREQLYPYSWNQVLAKFWRDFLAGVSQQEANYTSAYTSLLTTGVVEQLYGLSEKSKIQ